DAPLAPEDAPLFEALRAWRLDMARQEKIAPFVIFHDATLRAIARTRPQTNDALLGIDGIGERRVSQHGAVVLAICAQHPRAESKRDAVEEFLTRAHPKPLRGPWRAGFALDFHSKFVGAQHVRTELGELLYRFKYGGEQALGETLAARLAEFIGAHADLARTDLLAPIPSTQKDRAYDPVPLLARLIAAKTRIALNDAALVKTHATEPQKEMVNLAQKSSNVAGAFSIAQPNAIRYKCVLLFDDFYDSGATLAEAARMLTSAGAREVCVLTVTKTIHAD
ncbi:MAG TPA: HRDC domain-containing protein, partial [Anaerolineae bacterium]